MVDFIIIALLSLLVFLIVILGNMISRYFYTINNLYFSTIISIRSILSYIARKLRQFFSFLKRLLFRKKRTLEYQKAHCLYSELSVMCLED